MSKSVYEMVTDRIIKQLESGVIPWEKPWTGVRSGAYNRVSKKSYSLLNQMLLSKEGEWATFKQWTELGGKIRKGEKSEMIVFWKVLPVEEVQEDGTKIIKQIPLLKYINVFHISQVEGVEPLQKEKLNDIEPIEQAESILQDYWTREHITVEHIKGDKAFYSPMRDLIQLPLFEQFESSEEYIQSVRDCSEIQFEEELLREVYFNSKICTKKMVTFRYGILFGGLSIFLIVICSIFYYCAYTIH